MSDWVSERIRALVAAAEDAVQRSRWIFLVLNLSCALMIASQLNLYLPWVRNVHDRVVQIDAIERAKAIRRQNEVAQKNEVAKKNQIAIDNKAVVENEIETSNEEARHKDNEAILARIDKVVWDDLYNVSLPLLGIRYSADDLIILGNLTMSGLVLWFVYALRREDHCIAALNRIAQEAKSKDQALAAYIYAAVAHHFVFTTTTQNDKPGRKGGTDRSLRWSVVFLMNLPWIASLMVVVVMALSLFIPELKLMKVPNPAIPAFFQFDRFEQFEAILRMVWGLGFTLLTRHFCVAARGHDQNTHMMLVEMREAAGESGEE